MKWRRTKTRKLKPYSGTCPKCHASMPIWGQAVYVGDYITMPGICQETVECPKGHRWRVWNYNGRPYFRDTLRLERLD